MTTDPVGPLVLEETNDRCYGFRALPAIPGALILTTYTSLVSLVGSVPVQSLSRLSGT